MSRAFSPLAAFHDRVAHIAVAGALTAGLVLWFAVSGQTARVRYLGPGPATSSDGLAYPDIEPPAPYAMERAVLATMKAGCRFDISYTVATGRQRSARTRTIRSATLVDCP